MAKVLVTGGAGYIGSQTTRELSRAGHHTVVFDNFSTGHRENVRQTEYVEGDLADKARLLEVFRSRRFDAVVHFASHCYVGESYQNPHKYYHDNLINALNLLQAMVQNGVRNFIFSSTCAVYGIPNILPIPENHSTSPINSYGHSKRCIEWMLEDFEHAHGLKYTALRYFNAAGADPDGDLGENHDPETHLIPRIFMAANGLLEHLEIVGRDYPSADGTCIRDYIHVKDLAQAHLIALERLLAGSPSDYFNLGTGQGFSVQQILEACELIAGKPIPVVFGPRRLGDPPELVADNRKACADLGWEPKYSDLGTVIKTAWTWFCKS